MFMGEYTHNIDRKGRLIMPAKFREELGERVYITRGMDGCLTVYPLQEWTNLYAKYSSLPSTNPDARMFMRFFMAKATEVEVDAQGRILIPANLMKDAALEKECYIIGIANRVGIWSKDRWLTLQEEMLPSYEKFAENLTPFLE